MSKPNTVAPFDSLPIASADKKRISGDNLKRSCETRQSLRSAVNPVTRELEEANPQLLRLLVADSVGASSSRILRWMNSRGLSLVGDFGFASSTEFFD
jgi:hypothetical protein